jgi:hypothetical protein
MKNNLTLKLAVALALASAAIQQATAAWITGDISFQGTALLDAPIPSATSVNAYLSPSVGLGTQSGSYLGTDGDSVNFSPFTFSPIINGSLPTTLWSFFDLGLGKTFSFEAIGLTSVTKILTGIPFLNIEGVGVASGTGYSDTPGTFSFTFTGKKVVGTFAAYTAVPEPTTYAMVAGLGLVGFGLWRRRA